ncbi:hypothetical protein H6F96_10825 [Microcoleus sp. FACHB-53]|nr:hypothetical protein [Microcoleus sp. FACHB-53]MBD2126477.1 hypothetical protein [Microcoleus sp. FACHB-1]
MVKQLLGNPSIQRSYPPGNHLWAIVRLLPNARTIIVARFHNRQDADDHKRLLHRFIPNAKFEIIFDLPNEKPEENQTHAPS